MNGQNSLAWCLAPVKSVVISHYTIVIFEVNLIRAILNTNVHIMYIQSVNVLQVVTDICDK